MVRTEYVLTGGPTGLTAAVIADLHENDPAEVLAELEAIRPDVVFIAGDTFERRTDEEHLERIRKMPVFQKVVCWLAWRFDDAFELLSFRRTEPTRENAYRFLRGAAKRNVPIFLSLGNHDPHLEPEDVAVINETGTTLLDNRDVTVWLRGREVHVGGLSGDADEAWLDSFCQKKGYRILLCHRPEYYDTYIKGRDCNLILAGHAHGGQIRIFGKGLFSPGQGIWPKYHHGIYDGRLVVSAGCANTSAVPRIGNPCEIVALRWN